ncbi:MAG TPA: hypothetical protein VHQ47_15030, partial [Phycisphaerae bacterium]|nr:hypothetical protein [Phycisphaerae bacterium]
GGGGGAATQSALRRAETRAASMGRMARRRATLPARRGKAEIAAAPIVFHGPAAWITREQVEKIPLHSVVDAGAGKGAEASDALVFPDVSAGVHFERAEFATGEAAPVTLVVHSSVPGQTRGIRAAVDLGGAGAVPRVAGSARLQLVKLGPEGKEQVVAAVNPPEGEGQEVPEMVLKPDDYWVIRGDVRALVPGARGGGAGKLEPGRYVLRFWVDGQRAEGRFTVTADPAEVAATQGEPAVQAALLGHTMLFSLSGGWQARKAAPRNAPADEWPMTSPYPMARTLDDFEPALGLGIGEGADERYYGHVADLPAADDVVAIRAEADADGGHVKVTLTPREKGRMLPRYPSIYLLYDGLTEAPRVRGANQREFIQTGDSVAFTRPAVITITMPDGGPSSAYQGKARLSVMVASDPVWYGPATAGDDSGGLVLGPNGPARPGRQGSAAGRWVGIVKSAPVDVKLAGPGE